MKTAWLLFAITLLILIGVGIWKKTNIQDENVDSRLSAVTTKTNTAGGMANVAPTREALTEATEVPAKRYTGSLPVKVLRDSLVQFALNQKGLPYKIAGIARTGFDCSGFVHFTFAEFGINIPHSSKLLAKEGIAIPRELAQKADIVIFTGTNKKDRTPGHVGIVISNPHQPLEFVHSSSNGGVKISKVDSTGYAGRFLQVRRVLN